MKKSLYSIFLFSSSFFYLSKIFTSSNYFVNTIEDFKKLSSKTNIDLIFFVFSIIVFGIYGDDSVSEFIYFQF